MTQKQVDKAYAKWKGFSARGSMCPICKREFRSEACPHSVVEAELRLHEDYLRALLAKEKT